MLTLAVMGMYRKGVEGDIVGLIVRQSIFRKALLELLSFIDVEDNRTYRMHPLGTRAVFTHSAALPSALIAPQM